MNTALEQSLALVNNAQIALLTTYGAKGFPVTRAMLKMENEGLETIWFSTNTSSKKVTQLRINPKASVYFFDSQTYSGVLLLGTVEILQDAESRTRLWRPGFEKYYPQGKNDPDYTVIRFNAHHGTYYHHLTTVEFNVKPHTESRKK